MKEQLNPPAKPSTNKLKLLHRDASQFMFSHMNLIGSDFKRIQTGQGFGFATKCQKSIEVEPSYITIKPSQDNIYLYFKYPVTGGKATLISSEEELFDNKDYYLVFLKSSTYKELQF